MLINGSIIGDHRPEIQERAISKYRIARKIRTSQSALRKWLKSLVADELTLHRFSEAEFCWVAESFLMYCLTVFAIYLKDHWIITRLYLSYLLIRLYLINSFSNTEWTVSKDREVLVQYRRTEKYVLESDSV